MPVITPTNFLAVSNQGMVSLTWNPVPLATGYIINRSDGVLPFAPITTVPVTSFNDVPPTLNTVFHYNIQSTDGIDQSLPTGTLVGQALTPGQTTVGNLMLQAQQRTDRVHSDNISQQEWVSMLNQSYKELYDILAQKFGDDYFVQKPFTWITTGTLDPVYQAQVFALPPDFYKLLRCEVALNPSDPNSWITLRQFNAIQANLWNYPNQFTFYGITNLRYRLWGSFLQIVPISGAGQTIRIWYIPKPNQLINLTDTVDGVSGWDEYITTDVCIKALAKTEEDVTIFAAQKMSLLKRIEEAAENRNLSEPQTVSDSRRRNYAWSSYGDYGGSYGGYY